MKHKIQWNIKERAINASEISLQRKYFTEAALFRLEIKLLLIVSCTNLYPVYQIITNTRLPLITTSISAWQIVLLPNDRRVRIDDTTCLKKIPHTPGQRNLQLVSTSARLLNGKQGGLPRDREDSEESRVEIHTGRRAWDLWMFLYRPRFAVRKFATSWWTENVPTSSRNDPSVETIV